MIKYETNLNCNLNEFHNWNTTGYHLQWDHPSMVMVVYDVTNETSFGSCEKWLEQVRAQKPGVKFPGRTSDSLY